MSSPCPENDLGVPLKNMIEIFFPLVWLGDGPVSKSTLQRFCKGIFANIFEINKIKSFDVNE